MVGRAQGKRARDVGVSRHVLQGRAISRWFVRPVRDSIVCVCAIGSKSTRRFRSSADFDSTQKPNQPISVLCTPRQAVLPRNPKTLRANPVCELHHPPKKKVSGHENDDETGVAARDVQGRRRMGCKQSSRYWSFFFAGVTAARSKRPQDASIGSLGGALGVVSQKGGLTGREDTLWPLHVSGEDERNRC